MNNQKNIDRTNLFQTRNAIYVIAIISSLVSLIVALSLILFVFSGKNTLQLSLIVTTIILILSLALTFILTKKIRSDIRTGKILKRKESILEVKYVKDVEPGSGALYIPILGRLFPKLYGQKMNPTDRYFLITHDRVRYEISKDFYDKDPKECYLIFGERSGIFLGYELSLQH